MFSSSCTSQLVSFQIQHRKFSQPINTRQFKYKKQVQASEPSSFQDFQKKLRDDPRYQQAIKHQGKPFPKSIMLEQHEYNRKQTQEFQESGRPTLHYKVPFVQLKPEMQLGDTENYGSLMIKDLKVGMTHRRKVIRGKMIVWPVVMQGIHTIIEDLNGDVLQVSIYNTNLITNQQADQYFQKGHELAVFDPFIKAFLNGGVGIRVDEPKEIYVGPPINDLKKIDYVQETQTNVDDQKEVYILLDDSPKNDLQKMDDVQEAQKSVVDQKELDRGVDFYTQTLKKEKEILQVLNSIVACLLQEDDPLSALCYAYSIVRIDDQDQQAWIQIKQALDQLGKFSEFQRMYQFAPEDIREFFASLGFEEHKEVAKKEGIPMQSFLSADISGVVRRKTKKLGGSIKFLVGKAKKFVSEQKYEIALSIYLNALDLKKQHLSELLNKRSENFVQDDQFLLAALDSSASLLLSYDNNKSALRLRAQAMKKLEKPKLAKSEIEEEKNDMQQKIAQKQQNELKNFETEKAANREEKQKTHSPKQTIEDEEAQIKKAESMSEEGLQLFEQMMNSLPKEARTMMQNLMYDDRVPNFHREFIEGGLLPVQCDHKLSSSWVLQAYHQSKSIFKKLEFQYRGYQIQDNFEQDQNRDLIRYKQINSDERIYWWSKANVGEIHISEKKMQYSKDLIHSWANAWIQPMNFLYGSVHVGVGYVDLGLLLKATYQENTENFDSKKPLKFVGFEQSVYSTAKSLVITEMLKKEVPPESILQVWYSSAWSVKTLKVFRSTILDVLQLENAVKNTEVEELLNFWLCAPQISLLESQKKWLKYHPQDYGLAANVIDFNDRIEVLSYLVTGRLLDCEVGSTVMFANPPSYPHVTYNESIFWQLKEIELSKNYKKFGSIIKVFVGTTFYQIKQLSEIVSRGMIEIDLRVGVVSPDDKNVQKTIKDLQPDTMSWSNLVDYNGFSKFHEMARACCSDKTKTVHFLHSMNWIVDVKGSQTLEYPLKTQIQMHEECGADISEYYKRLNLENVLMSPPVDNPWNLSDSGLAQALYEKWATLFFSKGNIKQEGIIQSTCYPYSMFSRSQGIVYLAYTYESQ